MIIRIYTGFNEVTELRALITEYMSTLPFAIDYQHPDKELNDLGAVYSETAGGALLVAMDGETIAGCVAVKKIAHLHSQEDVRCCEMKRLYVRPAYRGKNLGHELATAIVNEARRLGYHEMYLDTHREAQQRAIQMYLHMGFEKCEDYHPNPGRLLCLRLIL